MNTLSIIGDDYIVAANPAFPHHAPSMALSLMGDTRMHELHWAINRALNCASDAPRWLFELSDMIEQALNPEENPSV